MKNVKKRLITVGCILILIVIALPNFLYSQRAYNRTVFGQDIPCTYFTEHNIGEYIEAHKQDMDKYYSSEPSGGEDMEYVNTFVIWAGTGNVNSLEGIEQLDNKEEIEQIIIPGTCISQVEGLDTFPNLISVNLSHSNLTSTKSLEGLSKLEGANLYGNPIETIEGIEKIRTNTESKLYIKVGIDDLKYITQESYDYIMDPANNVTLQLSSKSGNILINTSEKNPRNDVAEYLAERVEII